MIIQKDVHLAAKTTMKIGGYADCLYVPESEDDLIRIAQDIYDKNHQVLILSGGSNLLINDERRFEKVIYMGAACTEMTELGEGRFYIGASNRIQKVISFVNDHEYGGFERLVGLPAMFGGIIYMNAGIGGGQNTLFTIGDFIESVRAWDLVEKKLIELLPIQCGFSHRSSIFHSGRYVILGAAIRCQKLCYEEAKKIKEERMMFCKDKFEYGKGCFGTCFSTVNHRILKIVSVVDKVMKLGKGRVTFGKLNRNWLVNNGSGRYRDAIRIINACQLAHRLCFQKIKREIIIWD